MRGQDPVKDWSLVIERVTLEDDGIFQCQVKMIITNHSIFVSSVQQTVNIR